MNEVTFIGHIGQIETKVLESGVDMAKMSIATKESFKDKEGQWQDQTEWHNIIFWRKAAKKAGEQLKKGDKVMIRGKLTHRSYEAQDGTKKHITEVVGRFFEKMAKYNPNAIPEPSPLTDGVQGSLAIPNTETFDPNKPSEKDDDLPF